MFFRWLWILINLQYKLSTFKGCPKISCYNSYILGDTILYFSLNVIFLKSFPWKVIRQMHGIKKNKSTIKINNIFRNSFRKRTLTLLFFSARRPTTRDSLGPFPGPGKGLGEPITVNTIILFFPIFWWPNNFLFQNKQNQIIFRLFKNLLNLKLSSVFFRNFLFYDNFLVYL